MPTRIYGPREAAQSVAGTYTWICPPCVTSLRVQLWGAGGAGGGVTAANTASSGGAGGQYVESQVTVTPYTTYTIVVGAGVTGTSDATTIVNGNDTTFGGTIVVAKGGAGGCVGTNGVGSTAGGVGDTVYAGGSGALGNTATIGSGGGGGGGGSTGTGNTTTTASAGAYKNYNGGLGGPGRSAGSYGTGANASTNGVHSGGGGGGALNNATVATRKGGNSAPGRFRLTYEDYTLGFFDSLP